MSRPHLVQSAEYTARLNRHLKQGAKGERRKTGPRFALDAAWKAERKARLDRLMRGGRP